MSDLLSLPFMQRAVVGGVLVGWDAILEKRG